MTSEYGPRVISLHGHDVTYRMAGNGPVVVLIHGLAGSSTTWKTVMPLLAKRFTVVAPDLMGHGGSAKPRGDYSLGAYASGVRDLMVALGIDRATIVGHSLGGGVAMQLAYQFPERCERLVLVASGGLGREVSLFLRAVSLPGSEYIIPVVLNARFRSIAERVGSLLGRAGWRPDSTQAEMWRSYTNLTEHKGQQAFVHTVRSVIDVAGQRVDASDRLYLAASMPTLIVWGDQDRIIPVGHAGTTHQAIPNSRLEILHGVGHLLPFTHGERFVELLVDFIDSTTPAEGGVDTFRQALLDQAATPPVGEHEVTTAQS